MSEHGKDHLGNPISPSVEFPVRTATLSGLHCNPLAMALHLLRKTGGDGLLGRALLKFYKVTPRLGARPSDRLLVFGETKPGVGLWVITQVRHADSNAWPGGYVLIAYYFMTTDRADFISLSHSFQLAATLTTSKLRFVSVNVQPLTAVKPVPPRMLLGRL